MPEKDDDKTPDFTKGVHLSSIPDGGILAGLVGDDPVLLTRDGDALRAFGATCTHLGAPLGKGLVVGGEIRCPWHHACFDLKTGRAKAAPAFDPLQPWTAERDGMLVTVTGKSPVLAPDRGKAPNDDLRFVIVGGGAAGYAAAFELHRQGFGGTVTMVTSESHEPYDRTLLTKDYLDGHYGDDRLPIARPSLAQLGVDLLADTTACRIDRPRRELALSDGRVLPYDKLLLATGAEPKSLDVPGADQPHVHVLRSLSDCRALLDSLKAARPVVIVGSSFIGLEAAASLRSKGHDVTVVTPETRPMQSVLGPELSDAIVAVHRANGVGFRLGIDVAGIAAESVALSDGSALPAGVVLVAIGVTPRVALARAAGLGSDDGIAVDSTMTTSDPDILAAGDIACWPDPRSERSIRVEHWAVAQRQGQAAARTMMGRPEIYDVVPFFWSKHFDFSFRYVGHAEEWDGIEIDGDLSRRSAVIHYRKNGRDMAVATVEQDLRALEIERDMKESHHANGHKFDASPIDHGGS